MENNHKIGFEKKTSNQLKSLMFSFGHGNSYSKDHEGHEHLIV